MSKNDLHIPLEIHHLFLSFQRRRGFIRRGYSKFAVSMIQGEILSALASDPEISMSKIADTLGVRKSTITRQMSALKKKRYIDINCSEIDARKRILKLTEKGISLLCALDHCLGSIMSDSLSGLIPPEQSKLAELTLRLALGLGAKPLPVRPEEHPMNYAILALSRATKMYTANFYGSALSVSDVQVLTVILSLKSNTTFSLLCNKIPFEPGRISRTILGLNERGLISKSNSLQDSRQITLTVTKAGQLALNKHSAQVATQISEALRELSSKELFEFIELLRRAAIGSNSEDRLLLQEKIEVAPILTDSERAIARGFLVETAVREHQHYSLPSRILSDEGNAFGLFVNQQLRGVADYYQAGKRWKLENFALSPELKTSEFSTRFKKSCEEVLRKNYK